MTEAPQWALNEAAKRTGYGDWAGAEKYASRRVLDAIRAHALTIAKHEQPPVEPDLLLADQCANEAFLEFRGLYTMQDHNAGLSVAKQSALIAIRKVREMGNG